METVLTISNISWLLAWLITCFYAVTGRKIRYIIMWATMTILLQSFYIAKQTQHHMTKTIEDSITKALKKE